MVGVRGSLAQPVVPYATGAAQILSGSATTVGAEVVAANPNRAMGVWVQATAVASGRILVGSTSADAKILLETFGVASTAPNTIFIPGQGAVYIKGATVTATYATMEF